QETEVGQTLDLLLEVRDQLVGAPRFEAFLVHPEVRADPEEGDQLAQVGQGDGRAALADVGRRLRRDAERACEIALQQPPLLQQETDLIRDRHHGRKTRGGTIAVRTRLRSTEAWFPTKERCESAAVLRQRPALP